MAALGKKTFTTASPAVEGQIYTDAFNHVGNNINYTLNFSANTKSSGGWRNNPWYVRLYINGTLVKEGQVKGRTSGTIGTTEYYMSTISGHATGSINVGTTGAGTATLKAIMYDNGYGTKMGENSWTVNYGAYVYPAPTGVSINPVGNSRTSINLNRAWNNATYCQYNIAGWGWINENASYSNGVHCSGNSVTGLTPNTTYSCQVRFGNNNSALTTSNSANATTLGDNPTATSLSVSNVSRTSASISINGTYDTNASWGGWEWKYGLSTSSYGSVNTGTGSLTGLTPNTTYYATARFKDNWGRWSGWVSNSFKTTGDAPSISSHGVQTYGQTTMTMKYSASYDTNDSLSSYKWDIGTTTSYGTTFTKTNSLTGLSANTTYYYKLTVTSSQGRSSTATGSFKTDYATQSVTSIVAEDITETSISGIVNVPNPTCLTNLTIWIYNENTLINTITKTTGISATNSFLFEDLSSGTNYEIRARITTKTQNSSGGYNSSIKTLTVTTIDASPIHIIKSDGTDKKYKMYVMGKGNIYKPSIIGWQNGYYATGTVGQVIGATLTQSTEVNGGAAASTTFLEILPNIPYTITNNDTDVEFVIHGTDSNNNITTIGYTLSPGQTYEYTGTTSTNRMWISIKSSTNPIVNYATAKFFRLNVFRTVEKTLISKDNIVFINGKIRYIDIIQAGNNNPTYGANSHIVALKVYDSAGNDIALNKTVTMIKGKNPSNLDRITNGNTNTNDYASISGKTSNDLETIVRVDLGKDYTDIDHVTLWRYYTDGRTYLNTKLFGRDATTRLTWKFQDFRSQGEYVETSSGYSSTIRHEIIEGIPVILSVLQEPNNSTNTIVGTKLTINADWLASIPPVLDSWISYRTDAILAANRGRLLKEEIGSLTELTTTAKSSLVDAINEIWNDYSGSDQYTNILNAALNAILNK